MTKRKRTIIGTIIMLGVLCAVGVGAVSWFLFGDTIRERLSRRQFDSAAWRTASHSLTNTHAVRIQMVDDLLKEHQFGSMTRQQVTDILGEPNNTEYFKDWDMVYWLGPERGFISIDSEWLVFRLDNQKKVKEFKIVSD